MVITEALAEIKTIQARADKKREAIKRFLVRDSRMKDPLEATGGSQEFVRREQQALADLAARYVAIRTAIQKSNLETKITLNDRTKSVAEWLVWRKDVANDERGFLSSVVQVITSARSNWNRSPNRATNVADDPPPDLVVSVSEAELASQVEDIETTLGALDGKLSLINATTDIGAV